MKITKTEAIEIMDNVLKIQTNAENSLFTAGYIQGIMFANTIVKQIDVAPIKDYIILECSENGNCVNLFLKKE